MKGSGAKPYILKNVGGVYSCSCPAWRNQSIAIERRTCKHLRKYRGDDAEETRIGGTLPAKPVKAKDVAGGDDAGQEPPLLLAESWDNTMDLAGWWMSEKLDGVRAYWDGQQFLSRQGNLYHAPDWFIAGLPDVPLDGELWLDRKSFQRTVSIVRRQDKGEQWRTIRYLVFDAPSVAGPFEDRIEFLKDGVPGWRNEFVTIHEHKHCRDVAHLRDELQRVESLGGEGLMLREPRSKYIAGRSTTLLKVKTFHDAEATVVRHEPGKGKHTGRLGALAVRLADGKEFSVGTGFSDREREQPPTVGTMITFRYQELSDGGIPRFPSFVRMRSDVVEVSTSPPEADSDSVKPARKTAKASVKADGIPITQAVSRTSEPTLPSSRYFECVEGTSSKFWEVSVVGSQLTTRWGRIGSSGQSKTKTLASSDAAWVERQSLIESKLASGYREIEALAPGETRHTETGDVSSLASSAALSGSAIGDDFLLVAPDEPQDLEALFADLMRDEVPEPESASQLSHEIHLVPLDGEALDNIALARSLTEEITAAGFVWIDDYAIREFPVLMRAFLKSPNILVTISELQHLIWIDLVIRNADDTTETWSNVPMHDGRNPPWSTMVINADAGFGELHALMTSGRSSKEPACVAADSFQRLFEESYSRSMAWRMNPTVTSSSSVAVEISQPVSDLVSTFAREYMAAKDGFHKRGAAEVVASGKVVMKLKPADQVEVVKACIVLRDAIIDETRYDAVENLRDRLLKKRLPFSPADIDFLTARFARGVSKQDGVDTTILGAVEQWCEGNTLPPASAANLRSARDNIRDDYFTRNSAQLKARIDTIVGDDAVRNPLKPSEVWSKTAIADIDQLPADQRTSWIRLLQHCVTATGGKPTGEWIQTARQLMSEISGDEFLPFTARWFPLVDKPRTVTGDSSRFGNDPLAIVEGHQDILRGLVWCCSHTPNSGMAGIIGALGVSAYRKIRFVGARAVRVGNACVYGLGVIGDADAVARLSMLKVKVKFGTAQRYIEAELDKAATRLGIPRDELEEMSVPAYGLEEIGVRRESLGNFAAELRIDSAGDAKLLWFKPDGSGQKSIPAAVQSEFGDELKELKAAVKDIDKMLPAQRERIDGLPLQRKSWPFAVWKERYLDHPLVGTIARRLIWRFRNSTTTEAGIWHGDRIVCSDDRALESPDDSTVELWQPIGESSQNIVAWRLWLERHEIRQPFKQAHREIYILTNAEQRTEVYSNRFAAHVLRQTQFRALAAGRGWQTQLLGFWDGGDSNRATRKLPAWNLTAEFWVLGVPPGATDAADSQGYSAGMPYISTDQVRFRRGDETEPLPLEEVPAIVFSEIMRDVDLFVGVASVGNDPNWVDGGPNQRFADYWTSYSWGELSASAKTRHDVLQRLIPRLKIADRCSLSDRFLVVRGDLRTYKIHLGSGNILMMPNDQYLCIVPKPADTDSSQKVFLPFDGDRMFSIILSKAFLLAEDSRIKDSSITRQIQPASPSGF